MVTPETILPLIKQSARVNTDKFDELQLPHLIKAAQMDLGVAGVIVPDKYDALVDEAIITYCILHFGIPEDAENLKRSYDEQKAQLSNTTGYTKWRRG